LYIATLGGGAGREAAANKLLQTFQNNTMNHNFISNC
jgi:hypothetical protein